MKKTKNEKQVNKTGRALWFMLLLLIPVFLILFLLSTHFAQKRESEQEYARRSILVNITENEQQRNEERIQDVHHNILILGTLRVFAESADAAENALIVVKIDDVIKEHQEHGYPAQVVYPVFSHLVRPSMA